eukprot:993421-Amphidinium_carterae.1
MATTLWQQHRANHIFTSVSRSVYLSSHGNNTMATTPYKSHVQDANRRPTRQQTPSHYRAPRRQWTPSHYQAL